MMAYHRIVQTAQAAAAVLIGSLLLQQIAVTGAAAGATQCDSSGATQTVDLQQAESEVKLKCGSQYSEFLPAEANKAYNKAYARGAEPVELETLVHKASLKLDRDRQTRIFSVNHSTVVDQEKAVYYYCKKPQEEDYCSLQINVKQRQQKPAVTCSAQKLEKILLDKHDTKIMFACHSSYKTLAPKVTEAFTTKEGDVVISLDKLYEGATLTKGSGDDYTLYVPKRTSSKVLYYHCKSSSSGTCGVQITVEKNTEDPDPVPESATCTSAKEQVDLKLSAEYPGVSFACGLDVPILDPEELVEVYDTNRMSGAVRLDSLFKKAALYTDPTVAAYSYFLYIPYRDQQKELYYKCKDGGSETCTVKITVEPNKDVVPVCKDDAVGAYLSYEDFSENVKFKCDAAFPEVVPSDLTKVYDQDPTVAPSPEAVALTSVYSGATLVSDGDKSSPTFTLTIPPHLPRDTKKIYYQCKKADKSYCTVRIRVAAKKPELITCDQGEEKKVTITGPGEIVRFKCGSSMTLSPSSDTEVFDNTDNKCSKVADLASLVPNASVTTDDDSQGKKVTFTKLPSSEKALCYSCSDEAGPAGFSASFRAPQNAKQCKVLIQVKSAAQGLNAHTLAGHAFILMSFASVIFSAL